MAARDAPRGRAGASNGRHSRRPLLYFDSRSVMRIPETSTKPNSCRPSRVRAHLCLFVYAPLYLPSQHGVSPGSRPQADLHLLCSRASLHPQHPAWVRLLWQDESLNPLEGQALYIIVGSEPLDLQSSTTITTPLDDLQGRRGRALTLFCVNRLRPPHTSTRLLELKNPP